MQQYKTIFARVMSGIVLFTLCVYTVFASPGIALASTLTASFKVSSFVYQAEANLTATTTTVNAESGGYIMLEMGQSTFAPGLSFNDVDLTIDGAPQTLTAENTQVECVASCSIRFIFDVGAGKTILIKVGTNATYQTTGTIKTINPESATPQFGIRTVTSGYAEIDSVYNVAATHDGSGDSGTVATLSTLTSSVAANHHYEFTASPANVYTSAKRINVLLPMSFDFDQTSDSFANILSSVTLTADTGFGPVAVPISAIAAATTTDYSVSPSVDYKQFQITFQNDVTVPADFVLDIDGTTLGPLITNSSADFTNSEYNGDYNAQIKTETYFNNFMFMELNRIYLPIYSLTVGGGGGSSVPEFSTYMLILTAAIGGVFVYSKSKEGSSFGR